MAATVIPVPLHALDSGRHHAAAVPRATTQTTTAAAQTTTTAAQTTSTAITTTATQTTATQTTTTQTTATQTTRTQTAPSSRAAGPGTTASRSGSHHRGAAGGRWATGAGTATGTGDLMLNVHRGASRAAAHLASDPGDTISDYQFSPATITVHVGDTITWTNDGPTDHTATASDHSFDTGVLKKGQSASHTFSQVGTFPYICTIHPFMHGTVVVLASTTSTTPSQPSTGSGSSGSGSSGSGSSGSGSSGTSTSTTTPAATSSGSTLPVTGLNLVATLLAAAGLLGVGIALRRRPRA